MNTSTRKLVTKYGIQGDSSGMYFGRHGWTYDGQDAVVFNTIEEAEQKMMQRGFVARVVPFKVLLAD